jgi:hypothetical protein
MNFDFIHIGLAKCMSTTLQTQWDRSSNYRYQSGHEIAHTCAKFVVQHASELEQLPTINVTAPEGHDEVDVISSESFSFSSLEQPEMSDHTAAKQRYVAQTMCHLSNKVLIVIRDPIQWVRSVHAQSISQGGFSSPQEFVQSHRGVLLNNLHLGRLIEIWQRNGLEVTVLPMEGVTQDAELFWQTYESSLGVPRPDYMTEATGISRNASRYDRLELAALINRFQHQLSGLVEKGESPNIQDRTAIRNALALVQRWGARRALHTATEDEVTSIQALFNPDYFGGFEHFKLDAALIDHLTEHFVAPLEQHPAMAPHLAGYRESLEAAR